MWEKGRSRSSRCAERSFILRRAQVAESGLKRDGGVDKLEQVDTTRDLFKTFAQNRICSTNAQIVDNLEPLWCLRQLRILIALRSL